MGLLLTLCLTLRQFLHERRKAAELKTTLVSTQSKQSSAQSSSANTLVQKNMQTKIITWFYSFLTKYWIFLSSITLLLMSCQNQVVAYRIGYMILFLYFITTFQVDSVKKYKYTVKSCQWDPIPVTITLVP